MPKLIFFVPSSRLQLLECRSAIVESGMSSAPLGAPWVAGLFGREDVQVGEPHLSTSRLRGLHAQNICKVSKIAITQSETRSRIKGRDSL